MQQPRLLPQVQQQVQALLNDYIKAPAIVHNIEHYIVSPALGKQAGVLGAIALAERHSSRV